MGDGGGIGIDGGPGDPGPIGLGGPFGGGVGPDVGPDSQGPTGGGPAVPQPNTGTGQQPEYTPPVPIPKFEIDPNQVKKDIAMGWAWGVPQEMMPGTMPFGLGLQYAVSPQVFGPSQFSDGVITAPTYNTGYGNSTPSNQNTPNYSHFSLMDYLGGFK